MGGAYSWRGLGYPPFPYREEEVRKPSEKGGILACVVCPTNTHVFLQCKDVDTLPERAESEESAQGSILVVVSDH